MFIKLMFVNLIFFDLMFINLMFIYLAFINIMSFFLDIRQMEHVPGRSINLAMSVRGLSALNTIGLGKDVFRNGRNTQITPILKGGWGED